MNPILTSKRKFTGLSFDPLRIYANHWDGYGVTVFYLCVHYISKISQSDGYVLMSVLFKRFYSKGGSKDKLIINVFNKRWTLYTKEITPELGDTCDWCENRKKDVIKRDDGQDLCDKCFSL